MYKAKLYSKHNVFQKRDAAYVLDKFSGTIEWQSNEKILDIGCGDGTVLLDVILPHIPKNFEKIIGTDLSAEMIKFAEETVKIPRISFQQFDITTKDIPKDFKQEFNHIFSFYCLHWVQDQRTAFKNIYDMLKPGGGVLVTILGHHPIYRVYEAMSKMKRWAPYMKSFDKILSPYHHSEDAGKDLKDLLNQLGFDVHYSKAEDLHFEFPSLQTLRKAAAAVNPFTKNMPENEINDFFDDFCMEARKLDSVTMTPCNNNNEESVGFVYKLLIAYATKSL